MGWIQRFNQALRFIDANLTERMELEQIAKQADTSSYHFQRMFHMLAGITLSEYIRNRRLTLAASELREGKGILETAIKYGYETQASFTRAFRRIHGFTPGKAADPGIILKAYPPLSFQLTIKGENSMDYEIRELGAFRIAGISRPFTTVNGENYKKIPEFWEELGSRKKVEEIMQSSDPGGVVKGACLGICMEFDKSSEQFNYMIGMEPKEDANLNDLTEGTVPPLTWAVFRGQGEMPGAMQKVWKGIFSEWFPAMDYIHDEGPQLELYVGNAPSGDCMFEIWIPVKKSE